jgi:hypothetical protein
VIAQVGHDKRHVGEKLFEIVPRGIGDGEAGRRGFRPLFTQLNR